jgi:hypothetical protein
LKASAPDVPAPQPGHQPLQPQASRLQQAGALAGVQQQGVGAAITRIFGIRAERAAFIMSSKRLLAIMVSPTRMASGSARPMRAPMRYSPPNSSTIVAQQIGIRLPESTQSAEWDLSYLLEPFTCHWRLRGLWYVFI